MKVDLIVQDQIVHILHHLIQDLVEVATTVAILAQAQDQERIAHHQVVADLLVVIADQALEVDLLEVTVDQVQEADLQDHTHQVDQMVVDLQGLTRQIDQVEVEVLEEVCRQVLQAEVVVVDQDLLQVDRDHQVDQDVEIKSYCS